MIDYFYTYNIFAYGFIGSLISMSYFAFLVFFSVKPYEKNPFQKTFAILLPIFAVGFIVSLLSFPPLTSGIIVVLTYILSIKHFSNMSWQKTIILGISFNIYLYIMFIVDYFILHILVVFLAFMLYTQGKIEMRRITKIYSQN